jgi:hypothetical protein
MPNPLDGHGNTYIAFFTVNGVDYGFDIQTNQYGENTDANVTIRVVPWANTGLYTVVVQSGGSGIVTRTYKAIVYSENDYSNLRFQRGLTGQLVTPREAPRPAVLTNCKRADFQAPLLISPVNLITDGIQSMEMTFTMLSS